MTKMKDENLEELTPMQVSLVITVKNSLPCLEIRRATTNGDFIKQIISAAFEEKPIIVMPTFTNKLRAINSLIEKGIIYKKEEKFYFNI